MQYDLITQSIVLSVEHVIPLECFSDPLNLSDGDVMVVLVQRAMTSYVKLPKGYPKLRASHMTVIGQAVLQDDWVSVTSGSEDYSFKASAQRGPLYVQDQICSQRLPSIRMVDF